MEGWNQNPDPRAPPNRSWKNATHMVGWDDRFYSFHAWPLDIKPLPAAMASAGFYHSNKNTDEVICFGCGLVIGDWKKHDDPIQRHVERSSLLRPCTWMKEVTNQPAQYAPRTPPPTPPLPAPASKPHKCQACQKTFTSSNSFYKHRRLSHRNIRGRIGIPLKRPVVVYLGKYRVSKPTTQRMKCGRRGNTDLFNSD